MKKLFIFCFYTLIYSQLSAQLKEIFYDDFSTNKNKWEEIKKVYQTSKVENGKYIIDNNEYKVFTQRIVVGIDSTKDFSISVSTKVSSNKYDSENGTGTGLVFCSNLDREYLFCVTTKGNWYFAVSKTGRIQDEVIVIRSGASKFIKQGFNTSNNLKVERNDKRWEFYINDSSVYKAAGGKYMGQFAGFTCDENTKAEFDDFKISGTLLEPAENLCTRLSVIYESSVDGFNYIMGKPVNLKTYNKIFRCLLYPENDSLTTITKSFSNEFKSTLKRFKTMKEAEQHLKLIYSELEKCLPDMPDYKFSMISSIPEIWFSKKAESNNKPDGKIYITGVTNSASNLVGFDIILKITAKKVE